MLKFIAESFIERAVVAVELLAFNNADTLAQSKFNYHANGPTSINEPSTSYRPCMRVTFAEMLKLKDSNRRKVIDGADSSSSRSSDGDEIPPSDKHNEVSDDAGRVIVFKSSRTAKIRGELCRKSAKCQHRQTAFNQPRDNNKPPLISSHPTDDPLCNIQIRLFLISHIAHTTRSTIINCCSTFSILVSFHFRALD